jgi:hypothetical protein
MRLSISDNRPQYATLFDDPWLAARFSRFLPQSGANEHDLSLTPTERFLNGTSYTDRFVGPTDKNTSNSVDLSKVPTQIFNRRFSLLLNTFYQALTSSNDDTLLANHDLYNNATSPAEDIRMFARLPKPFSSATEAQQYHDAVAGRIQSAVAAGLPFIPAKTTATVTERTAVFVCKFEWLGVLLLASAALFLMGAVSLWLQLRSTLAPDMLRYVASMTYANPHFLTPPGGTSLSGMERAKLLRDVRVRIGDIKGDCDVGEVAFVAVDDVETRELQRQRLYA